jgi:hypothetical protein
MNTRRNFLSLLGLGIGGAAAKAATAAVPTTDIAQQQADLQLALNRELSSRELSQTAALKAMELDPALEARRKADRLACEKAMARPQLEADAILAYGASLPPDMPGAHHTRWYEIDADTHRKLPRFELEDDCFSHSYGAFGSARAEQLLQRMLFRKPPMRYGDGFELWPFNGAHMPHFRDSILEPRRLIGPAISGDEFHFSPRVVAAVLYRTYRRLCDKIAAEEKRLQDLPTTQNRHTILLIAPHIDVTVTGTHGNTTFQGSILVIMQHLQGLSTAEFEAVNALLQSPDARIRPFTV